MSLREAWDAQAEEWIRFARDVRGDRTNLLWNLPAFLELVPGPGRATLDLGCGEGRCGAELARRGHRVVGIDASRRMVEAARERIEAVVADATALPFEDGSFDLVGAFMSFQDIDDLDGAVREAARVLAPGGRLACCNLHPIATAGAFDSRDPDSPFVISDSYLEPKRLDELVERDGFRITFSFLHRPLDAYALALEQAGLLIEAIREPRPPEALIERVGPAARRFLRIPLFLHLLAVKP
ncbi:MAG: class I SAM-dependent methyltransferase [Actinomycetota bacterium]|nr:class I SAM-dependent methyltransferase [Actinomycetota bacterium]